MNNNPNSLEQAMENLRNQNAGLMDLSQKQALRRLQIQYELNQARVKLKKDSFFTGVVQIQTRKKKKKSLRKKVINC